MQCTTQRKTVGCERADYIFRLLWQLSCLLSYEHVFVAVPQDPHLRDIWILSMHIHIERKGRSVLHI